MLRGKLRLAVTLVLVSSALGACGQSEDSERPATSNTTPSPLSESTNQIKADRTQRSRHIRFGRILYNNPGNRWQYGQTDINHWFFYDPRYLDTLRQQAEAARIKAEAALKEAEARAQLTAEQTRILSQARVQVGKAVARIDAERTAAHYQAQFVNRVQAHVITLDTKGIAKPTNIAALREYLRLARITTADLRDMEVPELRSNTFNERETLHPYPVEDFPGGNMIEFLAFLEDKHQDLKPGKAAHSVIIGLLTDSSAKFEAWYAAQQKAEDARSKSVQARYKQLQDLVAEVNKALEK